MRSMQVLRFLMWNPYTNSGISILLDNHKVSEFISTLSPTHLLSHWLRWRHITLNAYSIAHQEILKYAVIYSPPEKGKNILKVKKSSW